MRKIYDKILISVFFIATVISIFFRIYYGWDHDESYNILLALRIADGKVLFKDMWDLHQTAAIFPAVLIKLYRSFTGAIDGLFVFLRAMSVLIQLFVGIYSFLVINRFYGWKCAGAVAVIVVNMLPRATQEIEYSTVSVWGMLICSMIFLSISKEKTNYFFKLIVASFFYGAAVYAYPTLIVTIPFVIYLLVFVISKQNGLSESLLTILTFFGGCAVLVLLLFSYLFSNMTIADFFAVMVELGKNGDHTSLVSAFLQWSSIVKNVIRLAGMLAATYVLKVFLKRFCRLDVGFAYIYIFITTLLVVILNITGIRPSGPFGLLERYIGVLFLMFFLKSEQDDIDLVKIFGSLGLSLYIGVLFGSNLGFNENAMYLEEVLILFIILALKNVKKYKDNAKKYVNISIYVFLAGIIFSSGYFIRVDGTKPANVLQCDAVMDYGPMKGIRVYREYKEVYDSIADSVDRITEGGKLYTILTREALAYFYVNGEYISAQYAATAQYYNEQWVDFYTLFGRELPDSFLVDKSDYPDINKLYKSVFGQWLETEYEMSKLINNENYWVLVLKD